MAEEDRGRIAAMLAADAELDVGTRLAAAFAGDLDQLTYAFDIERGEGVVLEDAALLVLLEEARGIVAAEAEGGLGEVVGAEAEELGTLGDMGGPQVGARQLDHGADEIFELLAGELSHLGRDLVDHDLHQVELLARGDERNHDLGNDRNAV